MPTNNPSSERIVFLRSTDGGTTFSLTSLMSDITRIDRDDRYPNVKAIANKVYMTWLTVGGGKSNVLFTRSTDGGETFEVPVSFGNYTSSDVPPAISISGNNVYLAWLEEYRADSARLLFTRSTDGGATFYPVLSFNDTQYLNLIHDVQIAAYGAIVEILFQGMVQQEVDFDFENSLGYNFVITKLSNNNGSSFNDGRYFYIDYG
jgi:hypothetical protein